MPRSAPTVYIRLVPSRRDFYLYTPEEVEEDTFRTDYLSAKDLPASITEVRLLDFQRLEERAEQLERDFDEARSYLDDAPPPDYFDRSCLSAKERSRYRRALTGRYEAAIAESDNVYDTYGKAAADAKKAYEEAKALEKDALDHGSPFTWTKGESLTDLENPERVAKIEADYELRRVRMRKSIPINPLRPVKTCPEDIDDVYGEDEGNGACAICHK